ncbi:MAG: hypothetical protein HY849_11005 [Nitrosomonadales bacterium]|nr:hypothetical protein [Nitrosomonadales bacterium]
MAASATFRRCSISLILSLISAILALPSGVLQDGQFSQSASFTLYWSSWDSKPAEEGRA